MANKNTRRARKRGLSANDEITIGTGEGRIIQYIERDPIQKGKIRVNFSKPKKNYPFISAEKRKEMGY